MAREGLTDTNTDAQDQIDRQTVKQASLATAADGSVVRALDSGPRGREFDSWRLRFLLTRSTQPSIPPG